MVSELSSTCQVLSRRIELGGCSAPVGGCQPASRGSQHPARSTPLLRRARLQDQPSAACHCPRSISTASPAAGTRPSARRSRPCTASLLAQSLPRLQRLSLCHWLIARRRRPDNSHLLPFLRNNTLFVRSPPKSDLSPALLALCPSPTAEARPFLPLPPSRSCPSEIVQRSGGAVYLNTPNTPTKNRACSVARCRQPGIACKHSLQLHPTRWASHSLVRDRPP